MRADELGLSAPLGGSPGYLKPEEPLAVSGVHFQGDLKRDEELVRSLAGIKPVSRADVLAERAADSTGEDTSRSGEQEQGAVAGTATFQEEGYDAAMKAAIKNSLIDQEIVIKRGQAEDLNSGFAGIVGSSSSIVPTVPDIQTVRVGFDGLSISLDIVKSPTKGDGSCGLHALFGQRDADNVLTVPEVGIMRRNLSQVVRRINLQNAQTDSVFEILNRSDSRGEVLEALTHAVSGFLSNPPAAMTMALGDLNLSTAAFNSLTHGKQVSVKNLYFEHLGNRRSHLSEEDLLLMKTIFDLNFMLVVPQSNQYIIGPGYEQCISDGNLVPDTCVIKLTGSRDHYEAVGVNHKPIKPPLLLIEGLPT